MDKYYFEILDSNYDEISMPDIYNSIEEEQEAVEDYFYGYDERITETHIANVYLSISHEMVGVINRHSNRKHGISILTAVIIAP